MWTSDVSDGGQRLIDPLGTGPGYPVLESGRGNGIATAALTCGIIGMLIAWIPVVVVAGIVLVALWQRSTQAPVAGWLYAGAALLTAAVP